MRTPLIIWMCMCSFAGLRGQSPGFLQPQAQQLHYNPAFAGSAERPRILGAFHSFLDGDLNFRQLSVDAPISRNMGAGLQHTAARQGDLRRQYTSLHFSRHWSLGSGWYVSAGASAGLKKQRMPEGVGSFAHRANADLSFGGILHNWRAYGGVAIQHPLRPEGEVRTVALQGGYLIATGDRNITLNTHALLTLSAEGMRPGALLELRASAFLFGCGYAEDDLAGSLGLQGNNFKLLFTRKFSTGIQKQSVVPANALSLRIYLGDGASDSY